MRGTSYPGSASAKISNRNAVAANPFSFAPNGHNLVEVVFISEREPKVAPNYRGNLGLEVDALLGHSKRVRTFSDAIPLGLATMPRLGITLAMSQSLSAVYIHLVFSTKDRRPLLRDKTTRDALHSYFGGISKQLDCPPILVGGVEDHIHLLARFGRTITQAEWVKELKRVSNL